MLTVPEASARILEHDRAARDRARTAARLVRPRAGGAGARADDAAGVGQLRYGRLRRARRGHRRGARPSGRCACACSRPSRPGRFATQPVRDGEAIRIMTGAPLPDGADTVVRVEDTDGGIAEVLVRQRA